MQITILLNSSFWCCTICVLSLCHMCNAQSWAGSWQHSSLPYEIRALCVCAALLWEAWWDFASNTNILKQLERKVENKFANLISRLYISERQKLSVGSVRLACDDHTRHHAATHRQQLLSPANMALSWTSVGWRSIFRLLESGISAWMTYIIYQTTAPGDHRMMSAEIPSLLLMCSNLDRALSFH